MKKKILAGIAILSFAVIATLNSYGLHDLTHAGDSNGSTECDQCKVTRGGETKFSCKTKQDSECSATYLGATLSCSNATKC